MSAINVSALAQAGASGQLHPQYNVVIPYYQWGIPLTAYPPDCVDDTTNEQMANLLGGAGIKLQPRGLWRDGQPNTSIVPVAAAQNFVAFADQPNAPTPTSLLVVNGGDLAQAATQWSSVLPQEISREIGIAWLIQGATMSPAAQAALPSSPQANWPSIQALGMVYWYTPPATS